MGFHVNGPRRKIICGFFFLCLSLEFGRIEACCPRRCPMQILFDPGCSPQEYAAQGLVELPRPRVCPRCSKGKPHKHGYYRRFCLDGLSCQRILTRCYYYIRCRTTVSFLPSFCIPKFQYSLHLVWKVLLLRLEEGLTLRDCLQEFLNRFPQLGWLPQRISFYAKRFVANLPWMESILRSVFL